MFQITILGGYVLAAWIIAARCLGKPDNWLTRWLATACVAGLGAYLLHTWLLGSYVIKEHGLNLSIANSVSLIAWLVALFGLAVSLKKQWRGLSAWLLAIAGLGAVVTGLGTDTGFLTVDLSWQKQAHIALAVIAYSLLTVAALLAVLITFQDQRLRQARPAGWFGILPPLETMESMLFGTIWLGFAGLSFAILSGIFFIEDLFAQHLVHKTVLVIAAWIVFAVLIVGRWQFGWRGRTAVNLTLGGFAVLGLAYFGSKLVLEVILGRQWG